MADDRTPSGLTLMTPLGRLNAKGPVTISVILALVLMGAIVLLIHSYLSRIETVVTSEHASLNQNIAGLVRRTEGLTYATLLSTPQGRELAERMDIPAWFQESMDDKRRQDWMSKQPKR